MNSASNTNPIQPGALENITDVALESQDILGIGQSSQQSQSLPVPSPLDVEIPTHSLSDYNSDYDASTVTIGAFSTQPDLWAEARQLAEGSQWTPLEGGDPLVGVADIELGDDPLTAYRSQPDALGVGSSDPIAAPNAFINPHSIDAQIAPAGTDSSRPTQIVFVDSSVDDSDHLLSDIALDAEIIRLDGSLDGVTQISQILSQRQNIAGIHIITHGSDASLQLGNSTLSSNTLASYEAQLQGWAASLTETADILIYGCDVASTIGGEVFVNRIGQLTGADVAASDDLTGNVALGGDWQLEYNTGSIEASTFSSTAYQGGLSYYLPATAILEDGKLTYSSHHNGGIQHDLSLSIANGQLTILSEIDSSSVSDEIQAGNGITQGDDKNKISVNVSSITSIELNTGGSADTFTFGSGFDGFSRAVNISINAGAGADKIKLENAINTQGGAFSIRGQGGINDEVILSSTLQTQGGDIDFGADTIRVDTDGRLLTQGGDIEFKGDKIRINDNAVLSTRSISLSSDSDSSDTDASDVETDTGNTYALSVDIISVVDTETTDDLETLDTDIDTDSIGDSGSISLTGQRISVGTDGSDSTAKLLAHVEDDSSYSSGDITIQASDEEHIANVIDGLETSFSKVELFGATIKGNAVTLEATSKYGNIFNDEGSVKDVFLSIASFVDNFSLVGGAAVAKSEAFVTIDEGSNITAQSLNTSATATTDAVIQPLISWLVGAAYAKADSTAVVSVGGNITTTGDVSISTETDSTVDVQVSASPWSEDNPYLNAAGAVAVSELKSNSTAEVTETAKISAGGSVDVTAKTIDRNVTSATSGVKADG